MLSTLVFSTGDPFILLLSDCLLKWVKGRPKSMKGLWETFSRSDLISFWAFDKRPSSKLEDFSLTTGVSDIRLICIVVIWFLSPEKNK